MQNYQNKRLKQITKTAEKVETTERIKAFKMAFVAQKSKKPNYLNIYMRITLNGKIDAFSTGLSCLTAQWDSKSQIIIDEPNKNRILQNLLNEIQRVYTYYIETENKVTFQLLKGVAILLQYLLIYLIGKLKTMKN